MIGSHRFNFIGPTLKHRQFSHRRTIHHKPYFMVTSSNFKAKLWHELVRRTERVKGFDSILFKVATSIRSGYICPLLVSNIIRKLYRTNVKLSLSTIHPVGNVFKMNLMFFSSDLSILTHPDFNIRKFLADFFLLANSVVSK